MNTPAFFDPEDAAGRERMRASYFIWTNIDRIHDKVTMKLIGNNLVRSDADDVRTDVEIGVDRAIEEMLRSDTRSKSPDAIVWHVIELAKNRVLNIWSRERPRTLRMRKDLGTNHVVTLDEPTYQEGNHPYFWCKYCPSEDGACTRNHERRKRVIEFLWWLRWNMTTKEKNVIDLLLQSKPHAAIADELGTTEGAVKQCWARIRTREYKNNFGIAQKIFGFQGKSDRN